LTNNLLILDLISANLNSKFSIGFWPGLFGSVSKSPEGSWLSTLEKNAPSTLAFLSSVVVINSEPFSSL
jgi:hypothetical protein